MAKPDFRYWVLWLFLLGIIVIVFLQVISGYNISRLLQGNNSLADEVQVQNDLRKLESNVIYLETNIHTAVVTNKREDFQDVKREIKEIELGAQSLRRHLPTYRFNAQLKKLDDLIQQKILFSQNILTTLRTEGKESAEARITSGKGKLLRDSIANVLAQLDTLRQAELKTIVGSIDSTGKSTRLWGFVIAIIALLAVVSAFWYILNQGKEQQKMIKLLNESDKRSKEVADMKEQFLANMSHEIRTPMNAILGFTNLLRRTNLNDDQRQYVQNIHSAGENLLALVNDILDLSKIEAGMMSLEVTRFSLHSLMSSVGAMFSEKIKEKKLNFSINISNDVPDILSGDAVRLTQILVNLLSNAVKFTEDGKIEVFITLVQQTEKNVRIRITICDTGIGISPEKQKNIFERFQQAETETTRRFGGTGLGLAIVKQLVTLQNGVIDVKSQAGKGSEFYVELTYTVPDMNQLYAAALSAQEDAVSLQQISVLIAEDNMMNQQLISHLMKSWGIDHLIVNNGQQVIDELKKNKYAIVLMDIQMPEMDGYTATNVIRNELKLSIPIIAMTAHAMAGEKEKCIQLGMNDYVSKPIKETVLYNMIGRHAQNVPEGENGHFSMVDLAYLSQLSGGDKVFEKQILEQFLVQLPQELQELETALHSLHFDGVKQTAHTLKSTVGYVGLSDSLHEALDRLEKNAIKQDPVYFAVDYEQVTITCEKALKEVSKLLQKVEI